MSIKQIGNLKCVSLYAGLVLLAQALPSAKAQTAPPVPPEYQDLFDAMQSSIDSFNQSTLALWNGSKYPVAFAAHSGSLNSNNGPAILTSNGYQSFLVELNGLKAIGVTAIILDINFPMLDPNFDNWGGQSANYLSVYQQAVADIRSRGMKVIVETQTTFSDPVFSQVNALPYYQSLSTADYENGRAQQALLIAQQLQPDYLTVLEEPDTEAEQCGKPEIYTYTESMNFLNTMLTVLRGANVTIPIGAGVGTWLCTDSQGKNIYDYINGYASTSVDSIDLHIYPVVQDFLSRMNTIAATAKAANKKITISEAWSYKERQSELGQLTPDEVYSRDVYSFWQPVDIQFLQAMVNFSYYQQLDFMGVFWSGYFRGYIDWDETTSGLQPAQLYAAVNAVQGQAELAGSYTPTGIAWENMLVTPADTTAPDAPVLTANNVFPNQAVLSWTWPNDNVGVARFVLSRDGAVLSTTTSSIYSDTGLTDGKNYNYVVDAYDAQNNHTTSQPLPVTTPDVTPPTAATSFTATILSNTSASLAWEGAADNVAVTSYVLYRGANGASPVPIASVAASPYIDGTLKSATSYCYYVVARDAVFLSSPPSVTACVQSNDTKAPTIPAGVTASGADSPVIAVNWQASTDATGVGGYNVQRLTNGANAVVIATGVTGTSYVDNAATPLPDAAAPVASVRAPLAGATVKGTVAFTATATDMGTKTTYTYQVNAFDASGNISAWSAASSVAWPANTSGIADVQFLVDGVAVQDLTASPYSFSWDTTKWPVGPHTLTVIATDGAGNKTTAAPITVTIADKTAPTVPTGLAAAAGTPPNVSLSWTASTDAYGVAGYNIQRKTNSTGTYSALLSGVVTNGAVDTTASPLPDTAAPAASVKAPLANATVTGTTAFTASVYDNGTTTTFFYQVNAYDASNNVSAWSGAGTVTLPANTSGIAGVRFLVDGADVAPEVTAAPYWISWNSATATDGSHTLTVIARDKAGNTTTSAPISITTKNGPTVPGGLTGAGTSPSPITLSWSASTDASGIAGYTVQRRLSTASGYSAVASGVTGTGFADTTATLAPDIAAPVTSVAAPAANAAVTGKVSFQAGATDTGTKTYYIYQVNAVDNAGNVSSWSAPVTVTYGTNTSGIAGVRFLVDGVDAAPEVTASPYYIVWNSATVTDGTHSLTVIARDAAGNTTTSAPVAVTVQNAPTTPTGLTGSGTAPGPVSLAWTPSTDSSGVAGYSVLRKLSTASTYTAIATGVSANAFADTTAALLPDTASPSASVSGITAGATLSGTVTFASSAYDIGSKTYYNYEVSAYDGAGNASPVSAPVTVIYGTNTSGLAGVRFLVDGVDVAPAVTASPYYVRWNTATVPNGSHSLAVIATDNAGNSVASAAVEVTVSN